MADLLIVYVWKPSKELPHGHSAMKIERNGKARYYSWWPSKDGRATPPSYGPNAKLTDKLPLKGSPNYDKQRDDRTFQVRVNSVGGQPHRERFRVGSDKEMLQGESTEGKHATIKFYFRRGVDCAKAMEYWEALLATDRPYSDGMFNCHIPVFYALEAAVRAGKIADQLTIKKRTKPRKQVGDTPLTAALVEPVHDNQKAWGAEKITTVCLTWAERINEGGLMDDGLPAVILRYNSWDKGDGKISKHDFDPAHVKFTANDRVSPAGASGALGRLFVPRLGALTEEDLLAPPSPAATDLRPPAADMSAAAAAAVTSPGAHGSGGH